MKDEIKLDKNVFYRGQFCILKRLHEKIPFSLRLCCVFQERHEISLARMILKQKGRHSKAEFISMLF